MLNNRIRRLERDQGGRPCPVCSGARTILIFHISGESVPSMPPCRVCGRERPYHTLAAPPGSPPITAGLSSLLHAGDFVSPGIEALMVAGGSRITPQVWGRVVGKKSRHGPGTNSEREPR